LKAKKWGALWTRLGRDIAWVTDACSNAMTLADHHEWTRHAATSLLCGGDTLWQNMCAEWAQGVAKSDVKPIVDAIEEALA
jgi:hypothetical protein